MELLNAFERKSHYKGGSHFKVARSLCDDLFHIVNFEALSGEISDAARSRLDPEEYLPTPRGIHEFNQLVVQQIGPTHTTPVKIHPRFNDSLTEGCHSFPVQHKYMVQYRNKTRRKLTL